MNWNEEREAYRQRKFSDGAQVATFLALLALGAVMVVMVRWIAQAVFG